MTKRTRTPKPADPAPPEAPSDVGAAAAAPAAPPPAEASAEPATTAPAPAPPDEAPLEGPPAPKKVVVVQPEEETELIGAVRGIGARSPPLEEVLGAALGNAAPQVPAFARGGENTARVVAKPEAPGPRAQAADATQRAAGTLRAGTAPPPDPMSVPAPMGALTSHHGDHPARIVASAPPGALPGPGPTGGARRLERLAHGKAELDQALVYLRQAYVRMERSPLAERVADLIEMGAELRDALLQDPPRP